MRRRRRRLRASADPPCPLCLVSWSPCPPASRRHSRREPLTCGGYTMMEVGPCNYTAIIVHDKSFHYIHTLPIYESSNLKLMHTCTCIYAWNKTVVGPRQASGPWRAISCLFHVALFSKECHPIYIHKVHQNDCGSVTLELMRFIHLFTVCQRCGLYRTQVWLF